MAKMYVTVPDREIKDYPNKKELIRVGELELAADELYEHMCNVINRLQSGYNDETETWGKVEIMGDIICRLKKKAQRHYLRAWCKHEYVKIEVHGTAPDLDEYEYCLLCETYIDSEPPTFLPEFMRSENYPWIKECR